MTSHLILYVQDQAASVAFYAAVLGLAPELDVPGMSEFRLGPGTVLGLMPVSGARRLLGEAMPDPASAAGVPRAELYLHVDDPEAALARAIAAGARLISEVRRRDWGHRVGYAADPDGHILGFAISPSTG